MWKFPAKKRSLYSNGEQWRRGSFPLCFTSFQNVDYNLFSKRIFLTCVHLHLCFPVFLAFHCNFSLFMLSQSLPLVKSWVRFWVRFWVCFLESWFKMGGYGRQVIGNVSWNQQMGTLGWEGVNIWDPQANQLYLALFESARALAKVQHIVLLASIQWKLKLI